MLAASAPTLAALVDASVAQPLEHREVGERLADLEAAAMEDADRSIARADLRWPNRASSAISRLLPIPASPLTSTTTRSLVRAAAAIAARSRSRSHPAR